MAVAVKEMEKPMQDSERLARLESHVEHIQSDVTDLKAGNHKLNESTDSTRKSTPRYASSATRSTAKYTSSTRKSMP
jgi:hypothetical protein